MKLSRREKFLVIILVIACLSYLSYAYGIEPQLNQIEDLKAEKLAKKDELVNLTVAKNAIPKLEKLNQTMENQLKNELSQYLGAVEQEDIILLIHEVLLRSDVEVQTLSFSPFTLTNLDGLTYETMVVSVPFIGAYEDVTQLLSSFWRFDQNIFVGNINISTGSPATEDGQVTPLETEGLVNGSAQIVFTKVVDEFAANEPIFEWFLDENYDVENPFLVRDKDLFYNANYYYIGKDVAFYNEEYVPFIDIAGHWAEGIINIFGRNGYISGNINNRFYPNDSMTRMDFIILLDKLYRWDIVENPVDLTSYDDFELLAEMDINDYKILQKGVNSGYVYGFEDNTLRPFDEISYIELEFFSTRISGNESLTWAEIAASMQEELGYVSPGLNDLTAQATKAEVIYLLYYLNK